MFAFAVWMTTLNAQYIMHNLNLRACHRFDWNINVPFGRIRSTLLCLLKEERDTRTNTTIAKSIGDFSILANFSQFECNVWHTILIKIGWRRAWNMVGGSHQSTIKSTHHIYQPFFIVHLTWTIFNSSQNTNTHTHATVVVTANGKWPTYTINKQLI